MCTEDHLCASKVPSAQWSIKHARIEKIYLSKYTITYTEALQGIFQARKFDEKCIFRAQKTHIPVWGLLPTGTHSWGYSLIPTFPFILFLYTYYLKVETRFPMTSVAGTNFISYFLPLYCLFTYCIKFVTNL